MVRIISRILTLLCFGIGASFLILDGIVAFLTAQEFLVRLLSCAEVSVGMIFLGIFIGLFEQEEL